MLLFSFIYEVLEIIFGLVIDLNDGSLFDSVTAPIIQLIGSVKDFEADLRKAGINARLVYLKERAQHN